jgi:copper resistance protein D
VDEALILCRVFHFTACMALFGVSAFQATAPPNCLAKFIAPPFIRLAAAAILAIFTTTIGWLLLEAGMVGDGWADVLSPNTVSIVLLETEFGRVWRWRLGFAAVLLVQLAARRHDRWRVTAFWSALVLASLGFVGHGAMRDGIEGWLNRGSHALHLLAAGLWLGSLLPLLACLKLLAHPVFGASATLALRRFSRIGYVVVGSVLVTGVANTWLVLQVWPVDFWSPYQALLLAKIGLVAAMIGLALVNRFVLTPRLSAEPKTALPLRMNTAAEVFLGFGAVALVSILGMLAPI